MVTTVAYYVIFASNLLALSSLKISHWGLYQFVKSYGSESTLNFKPLIQYYTHHCESYLLDSCQLVRQLSKVNLIFWTIHTLIHIDPWVYIFNLISFFEPFCSWMKIIFSLSAPITFKLNFSLLSKYYWIHVI